MYVLTNKDKKEISWCILRRRENLGCSYDTDHMLNHSSSKTKYCLEN